MQTIPSPNYSSGRSAAIRLLVLHSTQSGCYVGGAVAIGNYFSNPSAGVSSHFVVDPATLVQCVADRDTAWCAPHANADGLHIEQCGYAEFLPEQWLSEPQLSMVRGQTAPLLAAKAAEHGIPLVRLTSAQVAAGASGVCEHWDITCAYPGSGSHWDCGTGYPIDQVIAWARGDDPGVPQPPGDDDEMAEYLFTKRGALYSGQAAYDHPEVPDGARVYVVPMKPSTDFNAVGYGGLAGDWENVSVVKQAAFPTPAKLTARGAGFKTVCVPTNVEVVVKAVK